MFLKNKNIIFKIRRSKVTDYAALKLNKNFTVSSLVTLCLCDVFTVAHTGSPKLCIYFMSMLFSNFTFSSK